MDFDVAVIGSGPAGIQAAIHAARAKVKVAVFGKNENSALVGTHIENMFGIGNVASGSDLLGIGIEQAKKASADFIRENVVSMAKTENGFSIKTETDETFETKSLIVATGISRLKLDVPGEKEFFGKGVSYCATCDCNFYKGKIVAIVGNETEAANSAEFMTKYASKTYWVTDDNKSSDHATKKAKDAGVEILSAKVKSITGGEKVEKIVLSDGKEISVNGVFIELGAKSASDLLLDLDIFAEPDNTVKVNEKCETPVKGIYACGDVAGKPWQLAKAIGQGCVAGLNAAKYARNANAGE